MIEYLTKQEDHPRKKVKIENMKLSNTKKKSVLGCFIFPSSKEEGTISDEKRKPGGWRSMPYILGNETCERLAGFGLIANFTVYLVNYLHFPQIWATNLTNIWSGTTNFAPLIGAFLSDSYLGRFQTLAYASFASFLGMAGLTLTACLPHLRPPPCSQELQLQGQCDGPPAALLAILFLSLIFLTIGAGGVRPCSLPFGLDQFDSTTDDGRRGITSFFNWYYFTLTVSIMVALTVIVYIQDTISWAFGLGIPAFLMLCSIVIFFIGVRLYIFVVPDGSVLTGIAQVIVASIRKRKIKDPIALYEPNPKNQAVTRLHLTPQFRFLDRAAMVESSDELSDDGLPTNQWRLCSVQKVEELKCLIRIAPIWASGILCFTAIVQQMTFTVLQALKMDRHLGSNFQIPAGSFGVISMIVMTIFIPIYDRFIVPAVAKFTGRVGGITVLQRMGIGMFTAVLSMVAAGVVEKRRRTSALEGGNALGIAPMSALWLAVQLGLMGLSEAFNGIAQIEFYYKEFPEHMRSLATSLFFCSMGSSSYLSTLIVALVKAYTGKNGGTNWLSNNINSGRLDYFYYLLAFLGVLNLGYFVVCSLFYRYKGENGESSDGGEVEMLEK